jgi:hypothetical protein
MKTSMNAKQARSVVASVLLMSSTWVMAWVVAVTPGPKTIFLAIGTSSTLANNATVNLVTATLTAAELTSGVAKTMGSNSAQTNSPIDNYTVCSAGGAQIYIGGYYRMPAASATNALLQVGTPAGLTSGLNSIPFNQISWSSTSLGNSGAADIPAGSFVNGGTLFLRNVAANFFVDNCHTFTYANATPVAAGTYTGQATYTLTVP